MEVICDNNPMKGSVVGLLNCSDEILLHLFSYVTTADIFNLGQTCYRLENLCKDRTFWTKADLRSKRMTHAELEILRTFLLPDTRVLCIRGYWKVYDYISEWKFPASALNDIRTKCPKLEELTIENFAIDPEQVPISSMPSTLTRLSLQQTTLSYKGPPFSYFRDAEKYIPALEVLTLNNCKWVRPYTLMAISKCPHLRELYLNSVGSFMESIPYVSLSCRYGFKSLEILDLRNTKLGNGEFSCFLDIYSLKKIHLECPYKNLKDEPKVRRFIKDSSDVRYVINTLFSDSDESSEDESHTISSKRLLVARRSDPSLGNMNNLELVPGEPSPASQPSTSKETSTSRSSTSRPKPVFKLCRDIYNNDDVNCMDVEASSETIVVANNSRSTNSSITSNQNIAKKLDFIMTESPERNRQLKDSAKNRTYKADRKRLASDSETPEGSAVKRACSQPNSYDLSCIPSTSKVSITDQQNEESFDSNHEKVPDEKVSSSEESKEQPAQSGTNGRIIFINCSDSSNPSVCIKDVVFNKASLGKQKYHIRVNADDFITHFGVQAFHQANHMMGERVFRSNANITDMSLRYFPCITDRTLNVLKDLRTLKYLDVTGCSVTKEGIEQLMLNRPDIQVVSGIELD